ncbi:MAG: biopolymer transporter ExbD [Prevotellaceae bacterium]|jgi:biopolymer transport protein ExbD|nr:biopolymer transporter ExbD [Prevotellaceae bacterium]
MAKFERKDKKRLSAISTASLPDVVFMLLFFFMTVTTLRETEQLVTVNLPEASQAAKVERKDLTSYIYIGTPVSGYQQQMGTNARIQLNDAFREVSDIRNFIAAERETLKEDDRQFMTTSLKVDVGVRMGIVSDVKQELRRSNALRVSYSAKKPATE